MFLFVCGPVFLSDRKKFTKRIIRANTKCVGTWHKVEFYRAAALIIIKTFIKNIFIFKFHSSEYL